MEFWNNDKWNINNTKRGVVASWRDIVFFAQRRKDTTSNSINPSYNFTQRRKGAKAQRTLLLHHSTTPLLQHSITPLLHHSNTPLLHSILLAFLIFTLSACQTNDNNLKLARIDSISNRMEEIAIVYLEIDTLEIDSFYNITIHNLKSLAKLDINNSNKLIFNYSTLRKGFKEFIKRRPYTLEELEFCRNQIENLYDDTKSGMLTDEDFELFLKHEENASQSLRVQMSYYQARIAAQVQKFKTMNPQINSLIDSLNHK